MNLSDDPDYDLTFEWWAKNKLEQDISAHIEEQNNLKKNNPFLKEDIKPEVLTDITTEKEQQNIPEIEKTSSNPLTKIWNWYKNAKIKPYVKVRDFNNQGNDEFKFEENEPKSGVEIGLRFDF